MPDAPHPTNGSLLYLSREEVASLLPGTLEQVDLAEATYRALSHGRVELPPKPAIHPRENGFIHAMPTYLEEEDVAVLKWVSGYADNRRRGLPYIFGLVIVNDAETGRPVAVMDGAEITAARTAAATAVCIRHFAPSGWSRAAVLGCGEQGRYHARMMTVLNPTAEIVAYDRNADRISALPGAVRAASSAEDAVAGADVVVTAVPISKEATPAVHAEALTDVHLVVAIDFDASIDADVLHAADLFLVDDVAQYEHYRQEGHFRDWRAPDGFIGEALSDDVRPARVVCCALGVAALDAAFANYVVEQAVRQEVGRELPA